MVRVASSEVMKTAATFLVLAITCLGQGRPTFEVASVRPSNIAANQGMTVSMQAGRLSYRNMSLYDLIRTSYRLRTLQIGIMPNWTKSARFDIEAQAEDQQATPETMMRMLQALIEDRFHLEYRREVREVAGYALSVDDRGAKLGPVRDGRGSSNLGNLDLPNTSLQDLCGFLELELDRPVVNRTENGGRVAVRLEWASDKVAADATSSKPSLTTALREQLGLKLDSAKVPLEVFVIDRIEQPSEN